VRRSESGLVFDIEITASAGGHWASCRIAGFHTNVISIKKDGAVLLEKEYCEAGGERKTDRSLLTVEKIVEFADALDAADVKETLGRQIEYNMAIAEEGIKGSYGANIGKTLVAAYGSSVWVRAKAMAAAGSDARMNGCELPVVINSGSGNQGITASVPVIVYARELGVSEDMLLRALAVSNLVTIHLKTGIGSLSAYCGSTSAGCGAGAGITYLYGGRYNEIAHTVVNAVAINSGMICDGAKASCAAKIASAVEAGLLGMQMYMHGNEFYGGDGIVTKGVENTINNVGKLARDGMSQTDKEIINIMIEK
jgi:L-cysteine desulfidase